MLKKNFILFLIIALNNTVFAQFGNSISKLQLYDDACELSVYSQMMAKDKLFFINNLKKEQALKEMDYAYAKISENVSEIDLNEDNPKVVKSINKLKEFLSKFETKSFETNKNNDFSAFYFEVNVFEKLVSGLIESMKLAYNLDESQIKKYDDIQKLRRYIQIVSLGYYSDLLNLNKSFQHQYKKNIQEVDDFIKDNSNSFLNDPVVGQYFPDFIKDWNFLRTVLLHPTLSNPKAVFSMSVSIDYHLRKVKAKYINKLINNKQ